MLNTACLQVYGGTRSSEKAKGLIRDEIIPVIMPYVARVVPPLGLAHSAPLTPCDVVCACVLPSDVLDVASYADVIAQCDIIVNCASDYVSAARGFCSWPPTRS